MRIFQSCSRGRGGPSALERSPCPGHRRWLSNRVVSIGFGVWWYLVIATCGTGTVAAGEPAKPILILAHYMPWYEGKPTTEAWGWHWTMNSFDPEQVAGGRRSIASKLYPAIGPYDSGDPHLIEYQLLLMKLAGIDGVIIDWYGRTDLWDYARIHANARRVVEAAMRFGMKVAVCYEDKTISSLTKEGKIPADSRVAHAAAEIKWLAEHWFPLDAYVRIDGRPVLLSFGNEGLTDEEWSQSIEQASVPVAYFSEHRRRSAAIGGFDWPVPSEGLRAIHRFETDSKAWPQRIPIAFPRFLDVYAEAKVHPSWGSVADGEGATFRMTLERALKTRATLVQIATWNDWGEGTIIEPSLEYGTRDLEVVQELRRRHVDATFRGDAAVLQLPGRLLQLRRGNPDEERRQRLDGVVDLLVAGEGSQALAMIEALEGK